MPEPNPESKVRLPDGTDRTVVLGRTGTGKTVAGLWHLSNYPFPIGRDPWVAIDFKNDEHLESIENTQELDFDTIPGKKDDGLFVIHPLPTDTVGSAKEQSKLEQYIWKLWSRENIGIFCDETFLVGSNPAFDACLTQGRSKRIPMIMCSQRPVWLTRFAFSEASFFQVFALNDDRDIKTVESFMPIDFNDEISLAKYQSWYYDVGENEIFRFNPVPNMDRIRETFAKKLRRKSNRI